MCKERMNARLALFDSDDEADLVLSLGATLNIINDFIQKGSPITADNVFDAVFSQDPFLIPLSEFRQILSENPPKTTANME